MFYNVKLYKIIIIIKLYKIIIVLYSHHIHINHELCIHSDVSEHLGCFHPLATMNKAAIIWMYKYFFKTLPSILRGYSPRTGIAGSYGNPILKV